jgi:uncharacterized protein with HEPN domain
MQQQIKNDLLYLLRILESIEKIFLYTKDISSAEMLYHSNDQKDFNACLSLLANIGEQSTKISDELKMKYSDINWGVIKALRNKIVHNYTGLDVFILFDTIKNNLPLLKNDISSIIENEIKLKTFDIEEFNIAKTSPYLKYNNFNAIKI